MNHLYVPAASSLDPPVHALQARWTASVSMESLYLAFADWLMHVLRSPGKRLDLMQLALEQARQFHGYLISCAQNEASESSLCIVPPATDRRFSDAQWRQWPFNAFHQAFLLQQQWWHAAMTDVHGVSGHHQAVMDFVTRQWLDILSPGNFFASNPVVLKRTREEGGRNLMRGVQNWMNDVVRYMCGSSSFMDGAFVVGRDLAVTPGRVVMNNDLIELIQYAPATDVVRPEPVLIVPAWIMKYYILDLSPDNSLIRYLVGKGYTVFCISWKNPGRADAHLSMDDYLNLGICASLDTISDIERNHRVHAVGYCLGGTLLSIAAAAMAREGDKRLASLTLLAAQTDFTEPGELALFIDDSEVSLLEDQMGQAGYLSAGQMAGAFQMLRSYDLLWSRMVNEYLLGQRNEPSDLMAWNADTTRMPAAMHSQYLRRLYLGNDLSEGRYQVDGKPVELKAIAAPLFCVATETDHVAPWHSVYKVHHLFTDEVTFVLTSGGHNAGIVSEPGHPGRRYRALTRPAQATTLTSSAWLSQTKVQDGSWWPAWTDWLGARSGEPGPPPSMGLPGSNEESLLPAPGRYVMEK
ncbi:MAG TPA: alpha/beta fold hydrolase [Dyella sp.]|uniref:PHA/PHB synthase family protein n=1 Tax=Dyella sp. TaxID=1869338 RepID=UPI002C174AE5|nr:alpha/beta fold hydrolase [Dyella sp.]HTV84645.1 alpha/beta fold hydrolase [Dyella sp.]